MYSGKLVFKQLMERFPLHLFSRCAKHYLSKYPIKTFHILNNFAARPLRN
ncbi:MAG: DUF4372 domain-containing protein [Betaproteobacteria bacterium]|nr:DUF4372 domain-containing protein [Betaproteobacteria bacterium]